MQTKKYFIKCKQVVVYNQQVELTDEQFKSLQELRGDDVSHRKDKETFNIIEGIINHGDVYDSEKEYLQVEINE